MSFNYEQRMRLKFNHYASQTAYRRLNKAIDVNNNNEIYTAIGELLLWIMTTHEWHKKNSINDYERRFPQDERGVLLLGLAYAYNSMKHNMKLFTLHIKQEEFSFEDINFGNWDFRPFTIRWVKAANLLDGKYENQKRNYQMYIEEKEVIDTFETVLIFLNQEFHKIIFLKE